MSGFIFLFRGKVKWSEVFRKDFGGKSFWSPKTNFVSTIFHFNVILGIPEWGRSSPENSGEKEKLVMVALLVSSTTSGEANDAE